MEILNKSEFMLTLGEFASQIFKETLEEDSTLRYTKIKRPLRANEEYVRRTLVSADELVNVCDQMVHAVEFLSGFRKRKTVSGGSLTRLDYMVYHLENYFIRVGMVIDRALQLVNDVFRLGIPEQECRFATVAMNEHVSHTQVARCLKDLEDILKPYRSHRNIIIHRRRYTDEGIERIEPFYILERIEADSNEEETDFTAKYSPFFKRLTDREVSKKKAELSNYNQTVFARVGQLFAELLPIFNENHVRLTNSA